MHDFPPAGVACVLERRHEDKLDMSEKLPLSGREKQDIKGPSVRVSQVQGGRYA